MTFLPCFAVCVPFVPCLDFLPFVFLGSWGLDTFKLSCPSCVLRALWSSFLASYC
ncbi:hypothetical protein HAL07_10940 [Helicobacter ailurogastricus]|uniref:Uncharacterized protein n=1 Tax=Helicobacter ailurogastricus TaxID=1578720 RepID=A0A0K2Y453_9HELI|nr:hypothetical protein HAL07_10940 [Helicobacter ailurogastricus]